MKLNRIIARASFLLMLFPVLLFITCNDDDDNLNSGYRIIQSTTSYDGTAYYDTWFDYEGNKISAIRGYNGDELSRISMEYHENDSITMVYSNVINNETLIACKRVLQLEGSHVMEDIYYVPTDSLWKKAGKEVFSYENENILEITEYDFESGDWLPEVKTVYEFNGTKRTRTTRYDYANGWKTWEVLEFTYIGNNVDQVLGYIYDDDSLVETYKLGFNYENDLMTVYTYYSDDNGSWDEEGSKLYTYDGSGNLESFSFPIDGLIYKVNYKYERGSGNYCQLLELHEYDFFEGIEPHPTKFDPVRDFFRKRDFNPSTL